MWCRSLFKAGNVYLAGETTSSTEISLGGYQNKYSGNWDAFLVKFNSAGIRQWATYYGADSIETRIFCNVDETENIYLGGLTASTNGIAFNGNQNASNETDRLMKEVDKLEI